LILKLLIFAIVALMIYKFLGGQLPGLGNKKRKTEEDLDEDTLVECETCGTFVTVKESIIIHKKYYCSQECIPK
jgi:uncharacterized protein